MVKPTAKKPIVGVLLLSTLWVFASSAVAQLPRAPSDGQVPVIAAQRAKRVAVIGKVLIPGYVPKYSGNDLYFCSGAGAGGASAAYYLQKYAAESGINPSITLYERSSYIGGRSTTVDVYGNASQPVELGASIFVEVNRNLFNAAKEFGLSIGDASQARPQEAPERLGVWNGNEFVFTQSDGSPYWWNIAKLLWKYGWAPIRTQGLMKSTIDKFLKIYEPPYFPFRSLSRVAFDLGLTNVTSETGEQFLKSNNILPTFSTDIIQASTRVNYAQNLRYMHALEAMVCMASEGAVSVDGGNWQIFHGMAKASGATVKLNTTVQQIHKTDSGTYIITSKEKPSTSTSLPQEDEYDDVILAAPFQDSLITFTPPLPHVPDKIPYVKLHVTLLTSPHRLSPSAFNLPPDALVPSVVLTTLGPNETPLDRGAGAGRAGFFSISTLRHAINPTSNRLEYLYKIYTPHPITKTSLSHFLNFSSGDEDDGDVDDENVTWVHRHVWNAYPYLYPRVTFEDPVLDDGLWYTSGIESFISTMETSSLMGMNVARLMVDAWRVGQGEAEREERKPVKADL
ncbi:MAG: hypothetical protein M1840_002121 [Geoglossum simile]|nr:MAG: hypothetical protein M1840_002121 [Geoglossum simile]